MAQNHQSQSQTNLNPEVGLNIEQNQEKPRLCRRFGKMIRTIRIGREARKTGQNTESDSFVKKSGPEKSDEKPLGDGKQSEKTKQPFNKFLLTFSVNSNSNFYYWWIGVISLLSIYNIILLPTRAVFVEVQRSHTIVWVVIDYFIDIFNAVDMFIGFRTGYLEQGLVVKDIEKLRKNYMLKWEFKLDLLCLLPLEVFSLIPYIGGLQFVLLRFNRIIKCYKVFMFAERTETRINFPNIFRISMLTFYILILIHLNGCLYFFISTSIGLGSDAWVYPPRNSDSTDPSVPIDIPESWNNFLIKYIYSFFWSTLILTTIVETPTPVRISEFVFITVDLLGGVLIFATIVGNVGSMIENMSTAKNEFQAKMDSVKKYLEFRKVGQDLEQRVVKWFDYIWSNKQSLDEGALLETLPDNLKAEIAIHVHYETLKKVNIFQDCEPGLLEELVLKLRLQVFSPGDYICRKGDIGKEMYIVKQGKLGVVSDDEKTVFVYLNAGTVFGEISILNIAGSKAGNRRTANVKSIGYSDLFCLSKNDLWDVLSEYPEAKNKLIQRGQEILKKDNLLDLEALEDLEKNQNALEHKLKVNEVKLNSLLTTLSRLQADYASAQQNFRQRIEKCESRVQFVIEEENKLKK